MCETAHARLRPGAAEPNTESAVSAARQNVPDSRLPGNNTSSLPTAGPTHVVGHRDTLGLDAAVASFFCDFRSLVP